MCNIINQFFPPQKQSSRHLVDSDRQNDNRRATSIPGELQASSDHQRPTLHLAHGPDAQQRGARSLRKRQLRQQRHDTLRRGRLRRASPQQQQ